MAIQLTDRELKKGSAELLILSLLQDRARHGYEIGQLIELRSRGALRFSVASFYPLLYRLESRELNMPDFKAEIRQSLAELNLPPEREAEMVEELSQDLEERFEKALSGGASEEEAKQ